MDQLYPITLQLKGKKVVIVGGGKVARRKLSSLVDSKAEITIISPELAFDLQMFTQTLNIKWIKRPFQSEDIIGAFLVIAATNSKETNTAVRESVNEYQLLNIADDPEHSNFHLPSTLRRGGLSISVSTSGASPILARKIRTKLEESFDQDYISYIDFLAKARETILNEVTEQDKKRWLLEEITDTRFLYMQDREQELQRLLLSTKETL